MRTDPHPLRARPFAIATMHGKEAVLAPPLVQQLAMRPQLVTGLDTDCFGTFVGDVPRQGTALATARAKARAGMALAGLPTAVASEGSFGPHPALPFVTVAAELVLLRDDELDLEVLAEDVGTTTNFAGTTIRSLADAMAFATRIGFPSHHVVLTADGAPTATVRGIGDAERLATVARDLLQQHAVVRITSDMRANRNPTRMAAIARAAERLAARAAQCCRDCGWPGYGRLDVVRGLPCEACDEPTEMVRHELHGCVRCGQQETRPRPDGRTTADAGSCPSCNP
jgi:hypothetical protein